MPESSEILAAVRRGYVRLTDMPPILGVTEQRCGQLSARHDFPFPTLVRGRRLWRRADIESWRDEVWGRPWRPARADSDAAATSHAPDRGLADPREARTPYLILPKGDSKAAYEMIREAAASIGVEIPPA